MKTFMIMLSLILSVPTLSWTLPVIMEGNYVRTAVSDNGTLGYGFNTSPGIQHDYTGTSTFGIDDYLTPGSPWEIFAVSSAETGNRVNNNASSWNGISGSITSSTSTLYDNYVLWEGGYTGFFNFTLETYFNDNDERISFTTRIDALVDLTELTFLRALDPDPDVNTHNDYQTLNGRGFGDLAPEDWVHSQGAETGLTIGLYSDSNITHNTGVSSSWSQTASFYLAGNNNGNGDYVIGLAFDIGTLLTGESVSFSYAYVMGEKLETTNPEGPAPVPEPGTLLLLGSGLAGLSLYRRRINKV